MGSQRRWRRYLALALGVAPLGRRSAPPVDPVPGATTAGHYGPPGSATESHHASQGRWGRRPLPGPILASPPDAQITNPTMNAAVTAATTSIRAQFCAASIRGNTRRGRRTAYERASPPSRNVFHVAAERVPTSRFLPTRTMCGRLCARCTPPPPSVVNGSTPYRLSLHPSRHRIRYPVARDRKSVV